MSVGNYLLRVLCCSELGWEDGSGSDGDDDRGRNGEASNKLPGFFESEFRKRRRVSGFLPLAHDVLLLYVEGQWSSKSGGSTWLVWV